MGPTATRPATGVLTIPDITVLPPCASGAGRPEDNEQPARLVQAGADQVPEETILAALLPMNISVQLLSALLENQAGFAGAQMSAMDNATRNAGDMIRKQTIKYNRTRQAMITKELIEIISGAEAL